MTSGLCTRTGLAYTEGPVEGWRIAKTSYGPLNPVQRTDPTDRASWYRFDTLGSTVYLAQTRRTAFAETLAMARYVSEYRTAAVYAAELFGTTVAEAEAMIRADWERIGKMAPGWIPAVWRDSRLMYRIRVENPQRWIDLTAAETIAVLNAELGPVLAKATTPPIAQVTLSTLTSEDRTATTLIADWLRGLILDDGAYPAGVRFTSKYGAGGGSGTCWAYWLRRRDTGLDPDPVDILDSAEIHHEDPDLEAVLKLYRLNTR
jgi:hypothetical protein